MTKIILPIAYHHITLDKTWLILLKTRMFMDLATKRITIRTSFDTLFDQLSAVLKQRGFVVCGMTDFRKEHYQVLKIHHGKHKVLWVDVPQISSEMLSQQNGGGIVLPCSISVVESFPGDVTVTVTNTTEILASISGNAILAGLARNITNLIESIVRTFEKDSTTTPDLITSWG